MINVSGTEFGTIGHVNIPEPDDVLMWSWAYAAAQGAVKCTRLPITSDIVDSGLNGVYAYLYNYGMWGTYPMVSMVYSKAVPLGIAFSNRFVYGSSNINDGLVGAVLSMDCNALDAVFWRWRRANNVIDGETNATVWTSFIGA